MTTYTENYHNSAFILSEANGQRSRENGTLALGQNLEAGTLLQASGTHMVEYTGGGDVDGILLSKTDASDAAQKIVYLARDAEVNLKLLTYPDGSDDDVVTKLASLGILARDD